MRVFPFVLLSLGFAIPALSRAQAAPQPTIVLTILAGTNTGHGLWRIDKQPLAVLNTSNYDTLVLSRSIDASLMLGASGTYFMSPNVGVHFELSYLGLPINDSCRLLPPVQPDFEQRNQQICDNLDAESGTGGAVAIFGGVTLRTGSRRAFSPYVRGSLGIVALSRSTVEVVGRYVESAGPAERQIIFDSSPKRRAVMAGLAAGMTTSIGEGYQLRLEVRDVIASLERVTDRANNLAVAPIGSQAYHHLALVLGLDVVLERKRGRRY